jgi:hypothetical protein
VERPDDDRLGVDLVEVEPARLAEPPGARLSESRRDRDDDGAVLIADGFELVPLAQSGLVDVAGEDQFRARPGERLQDAVAVRDREFARCPPRRADQVVMEDGDTERVPLGCPQPFARPLELRATKRAALVPKGPRRVETDDVESGQRRSRLDRLPDPLELRPRTDEPSRRMGNVVVAGHGEHPRTERAEEFRCPLKLGTAATVREIAGSHDELWLQPLGEPRESTLDVRLLVCAHMQVGYMEEPRVHNRTRL